MHGHEGDGVFAGGFVGARHQGGVGEEVRQGIIFAGVTNEYFEVFHAVIGGGGAIVYEGVEVEIGDSAFGDFAGVVFEVGGL